MAFGYRLYEVKLPDLDEIRPGVKFVPKRVDTINEPSYRPVVGVSLGVDTGFALPHVDTTDPLTTLGGNGKRLAFKPPAPRSRRLRYVKLRRIKRFVLRWCKRNLTPLAFDSDCSFETWITNAPYTESRKDELRRLYDLILCDPAFKLRRHPHDARVDCFVKDETYDEYKYSRGIYSRTDTFKILVGPIIKLIENELYSVKSKAHNLPYFIKKIPVSERPAMIMQIYSPEAIYAATDYTSFEGHFVPEIMKAIECTLYDYMIQYLPEKAWFESTFMATILGVNFCNFYYYTLQIEGTRMSGEMNTSLGNGFSNLMLMLFVCECRKIPEPPGFVEGDDGIFRFRDLKNVPTIEDYRELGFTIKLEWHKNLSTASFCGIVFDEEDQMNVTDPISSLVSFGWSTRRYCQSKDRVLRELLRAKSYSMLYSYPGCPILRNLALYGLRMTVGDYCRFNFTNTYEREKFLLSKKDFYINEFTNVTIGNGTRNLVYEKYGIPVETQILYEQYLDGLDSIQTLDFDLLYGFLHRDVLDYSSRYVAEVDYTRKDINYLPFHSNSPIPFNRTVVDTVNEKRTVLYKKW